MSENLNVKPFGLNVIPTAELQIVGKNVENALGSLWEPVLDYLKDNDNVFSGEVSSDIEKMNTHAMNLGMVMRNNETKHRFDQKC